MGLQMNLNSGWTTHTLGDVITLQRGFDLPSQDRREGPYPIVSSSGITGFHQASRAEGPGVVTGRYGTLGEVHYVKGEYWPLNTTLFVRDFKGNDPCFIYYLLKSLDFSGFNDKSSVPGLNRNHLHQMSVTTPDEIDEQRAIAHILSTLDDKIELNRQMNQTLEQIAAALFKSWFVDFDPVRAKAAGRQPEGMDAATAALFPDRLVESEVGEIPEGWKPSTVDEEFKVTMGQSPPGSTYNETGQGLPFYQGRVDFGFRYPSRRIYCTAPTRLAEGNDTLLSVRAPVGSLNMAMEACAIGRGVGALRHGSGRASFTYYSLRGLAPVFEPFNGEGTVFGSISRKDLLRLPILAPDCAVIEAFERVAAPLDAQIRINELLGRTLSKLRDTLLPRLLSGELRVPLDALNEEEIPVPTLPEPALVQSRF